MGDRSPVGRGLGPGKTLLPGWMPAMYKFRGTERLGNIYEWLSQMEEGPEGVHLHLASWTRRLCSSGQKEPQRRLELVVGVGFTGGGSRMPCTNLSAAVDFRQPMILGTMHSPFQDCC